MLAPCSSVLSTAGQDQVIPGVIQAGTETFTLVITDDGGLTDTATAAIVGQTNSAPVINFVSRNRVPGGGTVINSGDTVRVAASFNDPNNTPLDYVITQDGTTVASGTAAKSLSEDITNVTSASPSSLPSPTLLTHR